MSEQTTVDLTASEWGEEITFTYSFTDPEGAKTHVNSVARFYSQGGTLDEILMQFKSFLLSSGFEYVADVKAVKNCGGEISAR